MKNKKKILKIKENSLEIRWTGTFPQSLVAIIRLTVLRVRILRTDNGRWRATEDGRPSDDRSSAVQQHPVELKWYSKTQQRHRQTAAKRAGKSLRSVCHVRGSRSQLCTRSVLSDCLVCCHQPHWHIQYNLSAEIPVQLLRGSDRDTVGKLLCQTAGDQCHYTRCIQVAEYTN